MYKKIIFTGDIFRIQYLRYEKNNHDPFEKNIRMIYKLLGPLVSEILGCETEWISGNELGLSVNCIQLITNEIGLALNEESWALFFEDSSEFPQIEQAILNHFDSDILVIGWELPPYLTKIFDKNNIIYIDISLHPWRFMPDLIMAARSNNYEIYKRIYDVRVPVDKLYEEINLYKAKATRFTSISMKSNSAIFLGQTDIDASLISEKRIYGIDDIIENITILSYEFDHVYFKNHPHVPANFNNEILKHIKRIRNSSTISRNIYILLGEDIDSVFVSLSSGSLMEAELFGKKTRRIIPRNPFSFFNYEFKELSSNPKYIPTPKNFNTKKFWEYILLGEEFLPRYQNSTEEWVSYILNQKWGRL